MINLIEEILKPSLADSEVKVEDVQKAHKCSNSDGEQARNVQQIRKRRRGSNHLKKEPAQMVEQVANEEKSSKVRVLLWVDSYDKVEEVVRDYEIETTTKFLMGNPDRDFGKTFGRS